MDFSPRSCTGVAERGSSTPGSLPYPALVGVAKEIDYQGGVLVPRVERQPHTSWKIATKRATAHRCWPIWLQAGAVLIQTGTVVTTDLNQIGIHLVRSGHRLVAALEPWPFVATAIGSDFELHAADSTSKNVTARRQTLDGLLDGRLRLGCSFVPHVIGLLFDVVVGLPLEAFNRG